MNSTLDQDSKFSSIAALQLIYMPEDMFFIKHWLCIKQSSTVRQFTTNAWYILTLKILKFKPRFDCIPKFKPRFDCIPLPTIQGAQHSSVSWCIREYFLLLPDWQNLPWQNDSWVYLTWRICGCDPMLKASQWIDLFVIFSHFCMVKNISNI